MKKRDKLVLAGLGSLVVCLALAPLVKGFFREPVQAGPGLRPENVARGATQRSLLRELESAEVPEELQTTKKYIEERFSGLEEPGQAARGVDPDGEEYFLEPELRVAKSPSGKTYYVQLWSQPVRVDVDIMNMKNRGKLHPASVTIPGVNLQKDHFLNRVKDQIQPIPLDQAPQGLFQGQPKGSPPSGH